jgi:uncharacterized protein (TIGR00255 family)
MERYQLKSMTAYGRGVSVFPYGRFTVEIQSVNRRYLEININLPRLLMRFEVDLRKEIATHIGRGMLSVTVSWKSEGAQPILVTPNLSLAHALRQAWEKLVTELGMKEPVPLSLLAQEKDLLIYEEEILNEEAYRNALQAALKTALAALLWMKVQEGEMLKVDLLERLKKLRHEIAGIEALSSEGSEKYRQKLQDRLNELFPGSTENEERILREIAIYAERVDITEEIVRFKGHLDQFEKLVGKTVDNELETKGKTFDFLLQELLREINTLGSKAATLSVSQHVVTVKSELEKIREKVKNVE